MASRSLSVSFHRVPSSENLSDGVSRGDLSEVQTVGGKFVTVQFRDVWSILSQISAEPNDYKCQFEQLFAYLGSQLSEGASGWLRVALRVAFSYAPPAKPVSQHEGASSKARVCSPPARREEWRKVRACDPPFRVYFYLSLLSIFPSLSPSLPASARLCVSQSSSLIW